MYWALHVLEVRAAQGPGGSDFPGRLRLSYALAAPLRGSQWLGYGPKTSLLEIPDLPKDSSQKIEKEDAVYGGAIGWNDATPAG